MKILTCLTPEQADAALDRARADLTDAFVARKAWREKHGAENSDLVADHRDALESLDWAHREYAAALSLD